MVHKYFNKLEDNGNKKVRECITVPYELVKDYNQTALGTTENTLHI